MPEFDLDLTGGRERATGGAWDEPILAGHIADKVVDRLVTAVALGVYVPSQQLPTERELAATLGVSRTTIRDALQRLTETGYLEVRRGRNGGYFVLSDWGPSSAERVRRHLVPNWDTFEAMFDARNLIEPVIAGAAAERRTPQDCEAIATALQAYVDALDHDSSRRADESLHRAIAEASHNKVLLALSLQLRAKVSLNLGAEPYSDEVRRMAIEQHQQLAQAVIDGRALDAAAVAAVHFTLSEDLIRDLVRRADEGQGQQ